MERFGCKFKYIAWSDPYFQRDEYWEFFTTQAKNNTFFPDEYNLMNVQEKMAA